MATAGEKRDLLVIGGGVVGLWIARFALQAGLSVTVIDKLCCGAGASGSMLGALLAHLPVNSDARCRFQFDALCALPELVREIESETEEATGYARCGRVMPIRSERFLARAEVAVAGAARHWRQPDHDRGETDLRVEIRTPERFRDWLDPATAPLGVLHETLAAKLEPQRMIAALRTSVANQGDVIEGFEVSNFDADDGVAIARDGRRSPPHHQTVFAAGYQTFDLLQSLFGLELGIGVKGQAAFYNIPEATVPQPVIYDDGTYIILHQGGTCAVGSTTQKDWSDADAPEPVLLQATIARAAALCPALRGIAPVGFWAGVRPRSLAKDPIVGALPSWPGVHVATGGYKVSFGIAHRLARHLVDAIAGQPQSVSLPESYTARHHLHRDQERRNREE